MRILVLSETPDQLVDILGTQNHVVFTSNAPPFDWSLPDRIVVHNYTHPLTDATLATYPNRIEADNLLPNETVLILSKEKDIDGQAPGNLGDGETVHLGQQETVSPDEAGYSEYDHLAGE